MNAPTSDGKPRPNSDSQTIVVGELRSLIERIERIEAEKKELTEDVRDLYALAKGQGFDTKALRAIIRMRKKDADELQNELSMIELYGHALGMGAFA